ncbi:hypothetical protein LIPSTDRAFT_7027 [Lipomyces starkeyi NRRL Y-11557]|uniref:Uncharacterized protein n=1 Tax=Lipomyces starkeyi NRRL Y-11557 TaxID=675824 RepID=A0A1E3PVD8_LIPST|nr:hypothetical protein LIPSTDRAFT_7027 [Lipomyces starkeyi NRRL Y-11557]
MSERKDNVVAEAVLVSSSSQPSQKAKQTPPVSTRNVLRTVLGWIQCANYGIYVPRLRYDGKRQIMIVVATPTPLHGDMVGELLDHLGRAGGRIMVRSGVEKSIVSGVSQATSITEDIDTAHGRTVREWDGAFSYLHNDDLKNMIAIEVAVSQSYKSLQEARSVDTSTE